MGIKSRHSEYVLGSNILNPSLGRSRVTPADLFDTESMKRAIAHVTAYKTREDVQQLKKQVAAKDAQIEDLQKQSESLKRRLDAVLKERDGRAARAAPLKKMLRELKRANPPGTSQPIIARKVDLAVAMTKGTLAAIAPKKWPKLGLPRLLSDVFTNPRISPLLKRNVKSYMSKA